MCPRFYFADEPSRGPPRHLAGKRAVEGAWHLRQHQHQVLQRGQGDLMQGDFFDWHLFPVPKFKKTNESAWALKISWNTAALVGSIAKMGDISINIFSQ